MRSLVLGLLLSTAVGAVAATPRPVIKEFGPATIAVGSGERYLGIRGSHFSSGAHGPVVVYSGPAGEFALTPTSLWGFEPDVRIQVWVPAEIVYTIGRYSVTVRNEATGDSDPVYFDVTGEAQIILHVPPFINVEATGPSGAVATFAVSAESTTGAPVDLSCSHASGATFPLGMTSVRCTGTMADGSTRSANFVVSVIDRTPPVLTLPADILREATENGGTIVHFETSATDIADTHVPVQCSPASGSLFAIRTTEVRCSARDDSFNSATRSFNITVVDMPLPMLQLPDDITVAATSADGAVVTFTATAMDFVERTIPAVCTPETGSLFPVGTTIVSCTATDYESRSSSGTFRVTVTEPPAEDPPPTLMLPGDIAVEATSGDGATVTFTATAKDYAQRSIAVACTPESGSLFPVGTTTVTCSATDDGNRTSTGTFHVTVTEPPAEDPPPTLTLPGDILVEAATPDGTAVAFTATAHDDTDGDLPVSCAPASGTTFPLGSTAVTCSATNTRGVTVTGTFQVSVIDAIAPEIVSISVTPDLLWPVNKRLIDVVVNVTATDDGDAMPTARIAGVIVSEHVSPSDWQIVDDLTVALRADRNGKEKPRVYTVVVEVSDASGNVSTATIDVTVPHDDSTDNVTKPPVRRRRAVRH